MNVFNGLRQIEDYGKKTFNANSLIGRIRIQKNVYLLKILGYRPASRFEFTNYVHGPYSSSLADEYYKLESGTLKSIGPDKAIASSIVEIVTEADSKGIEFLEALTTLISVKDGFKSPEQALDNAEHLKPYIDYSVWAGATKFVDRYPVLWN